MAARQVRWAQKAREALREALGGRCRRCGTTADLEFDCIEPQGHDHHTLGSTRRTSFYRLQHKLGNLQLLCADCHAVKTAADLASVEPTTISVSVKDLPY